MATVFQNMFSFALITIIAVAAYLAAQLEATFSSLHRIGVGSHRAPSFQWKMSSGEVWHFWVWALKLQVYAPLCCLSPSWCWNMDIPLTQHQHCRWGQWLRWWLLWVALSPPKRYVGVLSTIPVNVTVVLWYTGAPQLMKGFCPDTHIVSWKYQAKNTFNTPNLPTS